ncbi:transposase [Streptomyces sp. NPDC007905]|uniref:transposase n=1 Tax=Streptomyces sp. NPDC007905 TaxID=3364788 RepID=UPI0036E15D31
MNTLRYPHAVQALRIIRRRRDLKTGKTALETVYVVTDQAAEQAGPAQLADLVRRHWHVENKIHCVRDRTFREDDSQVRTGAAPANLATLRHLVIGAFHRAGYANIAHARRDHTAPEAALRLFGLR